MNKHVKISLLVAGGVVAFGAAYLGFAAALGGEVPGLAKHDEAHGPTTPTTEHLVAPAHQAPEPARFVHTPAHTASLLDVFQVQSPYSTAELAELASELKSKNQELARRLDELDERERRAATREELLDERHEELLALRAELERQQGELEQRRVEVARDESAREQRDQQGWAKLAKLFGEGDAQEQAQRLAGYSPDDAAKILDQLKPARAKELLDGLGGEKWKEYAEAYRKLAEAAKD